ncbi:MAG: amino acid racemase [Deltaproteobacteria bacterium]|nr:amino acid racemase [Deltaproteobacteria bacterium]
MSTRPLGLIGGLAWPSTALYYRHINTLYNQARGGTHSAPLVLWSCDFQDIDDRKQAGDWDAVAAELGRAASALERAGAGALVLCTNTLHKLHRQLESTCDIPLLHIADAVAAHLKPQGIDRVGLLGTRFTMTEPFYAERLAQHGIEVIAAPADDIRATSDIIYRELVVDVVDNESRERIKAVVAGMAERGAQAAILGCTELGLLDDGGRWALPLVDTVPVHSQAAVDWLLLSGS